MTGRAEGAVSGEREMGGIFALEKLHRANKLLAHSNPTGKDCYLCPKCEVEQAIAALAQPQLRDAGEGIVERERRECAEIIRTYPAELVHFYSRGPTSPPGNQLVLTTRDDLAAAVMRDDLHLAVRSKLAAPPSPSESKESVDG